MIDLQSISHSGVLSGLIAIIVGTALASLLFAAHAVRQGIEQIERWRDE